MQNNIHSKFILTPISEILRESVSACCSVGDGIQTQPLCEYIMQTTFLKMTGASEQKLKCIRWEMATYDYEYRYKTLKNNNLGEFSDYTAKNTIFNDMLKVVLKINSDFKVMELFTDDNKTNIANDIKNDIISIIEGSPIEIWVNRPFLLFKKEPMKYIGEKMFVLYEKKRYMIFNDDLIKYYEETIYRHRNRCAHNLKSYQNNLPTLKTLTLKEYKYENYFHMFSVLLLLDLIYIEIYKQYLNALENSVF